MATRTEIVPVRLTPEERDTLIAAAAAHGMTTSAMIRFLVTRIAPRLTPIGLPRKKHLEKDAI